MKCSTLAILCLSLFAGASASSFTDGVTAGFVVSTVKNRVTKNIPSPPPRYYGFTKDTSFQIFPPATEQCIDEQHRIIKPPPTFLEGLTIIILLSLCSMAWIHCLCFADDEHREYVAGVVIGGIIADMLDVDD
tara:strand:- start:2259 stop:2657 length:399 start_codon:yes stop_codon:yes gene_type:complete